MAIDALMTFKEVGVVATKTSSAIKVNYSKKLELDIRVSKLVGTVPTLEIEIQDSADGVTFAKVASFKQFTAAESRKEYVRADQPYVRYVMTIGGTAPVIDMDLYIHSI